jgi:HEAT repeat protein
MSIKSEDNAFDILDNSSSGELERVEAVRYLAELANERDIERLVQALQDDDFGVRWEASISLSKLGKIALPSLLKALMDPDRVGDPRLIRGALRAISRMEHSALPQSAGKLVKALRGPAADVAAMEVAYKVLADVEAQSRTNPRKVIH